MLGVPGQSESVASMLSCKLDFISCAIKDSFCKSSHNLVILILPSIINKSGHNLYLKMIVLLEELNAYTVPKVDCS